MNAEFEEIFDFIKNKTLRNHLVDALQSAVEFSAIAKEYPEPVRSIFYKTAIIQLASIIEACLHYALLEKGFDSYRNDFQYKEIKILHELNDDDRTEIIAGKRFMKKMSMKGYVDFSIINRFCRDKAKFYSDDLYKDIDYVRDLRNKVHLMKLDEMDKKYSKKQVDKVAEIANKVLDVIEEGLQ